MAKLVRDIMKIGVPTCTLETSLPDVAKIMVRDQADALIVMDEFGTCGVVTQSDVAHAYSRNFALLTAKDVMTEKIISIPPEAALTTVANLMQDEQVHQIFIMHEHPGPSRPSAVITMRAIVREIAGLEPEKPGLRKASKLTNS